MKRVIILILIATASLMAASQTFENPAFGLRTPETMIVAGVEFSGDNLAIDLTVENQIAGGYFCADRNTYIVLPDGSRIRMERSEGIPSCPDVYRFKRIGEVISFRLHFKTPSQLPEWFHLIEECGDNCFSVYAITLSSELNESIERAYGLAEAGQPGAAGILFREILAGLEGRKHGIEGALYSNIVIMWLREGNEAEAARWYRRMIEASPPEVDRYIENLASRGIKW
ncbi:MAG: hypothetical protein R6W67_07240 [Bacteroidales bacterium]